MGGVSARTDCCLAPFTCGDDRTCAGIEVVELRTSSRPARKTHLVIAGFTSIFVDALVERHYNPESLKGWNLRANSRFNRKKSGPKLGADI